MDTIPVGWAEDTLKILKEIRWIVIAILIGLIIIEAMRFFK